MVRKVIIIQLQNGQSLAFLKPFQQTIKTLWLHTGFTEVKFLNWCIFDNWKVLKKVRAEGITGDVKVGKSWSDQIIEKIMDLACDVIVRYMQNFKGIGFSGSYSSANTLKTLFSKVQVVHFSNTKGLISGKELLNTGKFASKSVEVMRVDVADVQSK